ncbi:hypothetical protein B1810_17865 [Panacagrimonas perspica]|nr:hypothetical protein B1810_17865 [Panacagrimonas perspica]
MAGLLNAAAQAAAPSLDLKVERTERVYRVPDGKLFRGAQLQGAIVTMGVDGAAATATRAGGRLHRGLGATTRRAVVPGIQADVKQAQGRSLAPLTRKGRSPIR